MAVMTQEGVIKMSGLSKEQREAIAKAQEEYLAKGGQIHRCASHAASTGNMRFHYASKAQREREQAEAADKMSHLREMGFQAEAQNEARGR
jgi:hypothetical protein